MNISSNAIPSPIAQLPAHAAYQSLPFSGARAVQSQAFPVTNILDCSVTTEQAIESQWYSVRANLPVLVHGAVFDDSGLSVKGAVTLFRKPNQHSWFKAPSSCPSLDAYSQSFNSSSYPKFVISVDQPSCEYRIETNGVIRIAKRDTSSNIRPTTYDYLINHGNAQGTGNLKMVSVKAATGQPPAEFLFNSKVSTTTFEGYKTELKNFISDAVKHAKNNGLTKDELRTQASNLVTEFGKAKYGKLGLDVFVMTETNKAWREANKNTSAQVFPEFDPELAPWLGRDKSVGSTVGSTFGGIIGGLLAGFVAGWFSNRKCSKSESTSKTDESKEKGIGATRQRAAANEKTKKSAALEKTQTMIQMEEYQPLYNESLQVESAQAGLEHSQELKSTDQTQAEISTSKTSLNF